MPNFIEIRYVVPEMNHVDRLTQRHITHSFYVHRANIIFCAIEVQISHEGTSE